MHVASLGELKKNIKIFAFAMPILVTCTSFIVKITMLSLEDYIFSFNIGMFLMKCRHYVSVKGTAKSDQNSNQAQNTGKAGSVMIIQDSLKL